MKQLFLMIAVYVIAKIPTSLRIVCTFNLFPSLFSPAGSVNGIGATFFRCMKAYYTRKKCRASRNLEDYVNFQYNLKL